MGRQGLTPRNQQRIDHWGGLVQAGRMIMVCANVKEYSRCGRAADKSMSLRAVSLERGVVKYAEGSCFVKFGDTHVLVTASLEETAAALAQGPRAWLGHGRIWHAAARHLQRTRARGGCRQAGRPHAGNSAADRARAAFRGRSAGAGRAQITLDCDVIQADGGTRTASITGAWVALSSASPG